MLSINPVTTADYYLRHGSGCGGDSGSSGADADYELAAVAKGEPPGEWYFPRRNDLGVSGEIRPEHESGEAFRMVLNELRHPVSGGQLGKAAPQYASVDERVERFKRKNPEATPEQIAEARIKAEQDHRSGRNGWDLTFSAPKSWSVLHAALEKDGRAEDAEQVWVALRAGIDAALEVVAEQMTYTRRGMSGPKVNGRTTTRYARNADIQTAVFRHHTSRERDPQLHAHIMLLNRILCEDGQWRALETMELLKSKHLLDAIFLRVAEAHLAESLGVRFAARPDGKAREIVGVSPEIRDLFSARTRALSMKAQEMTDAWIAEHGGERPNRLWQWRIAQRAVVESRRPKPKVAQPRAEEVQRWDEEITAQFREGFSAVVEEVDLAGTRPASSPDFDPDAVIALALEDLSRRKATWNRSHLMHAINQHLPDMLAIEPARVPALLSELTDAALAGRQVVSLVAPASVPVPPSLLDEQTGESVFEAPTGGRYTAKVHLAREDSLVARLDRGGAPVLTGETAARVLDGHGLSAEQLGVATSILTSDRQVEVVNAAAGTGKSRLMGALSEASAEVWGHGLVGLTTAENAAQVLRREGIATAHNIAAFLDFRARERRGAVSDVERATFAVPPGATIVVDEASMVSTPDLTALMGELDDLGVGRRVLIGDTAQVDAIDAGGAFALLTREREPHTLTQVRRFHEEWEREASARLRDGDLTALTQYETRARIRGGGEPEEVEQEAVEEFVTDHLSGLETVLVVSTGEVAARLSSDIRQRLVEKGHVAAEGIALHDPGTIAGVGDMVQTRMNATRTVGVVNREVWQVVGADEAAGTLTVRRAERDEDDQRTWGEPLSLPASYVSKWVELAYASTVEAVQGRSVDTGNALIDETMGSSRAYPAFTRGRVRNTAWVPVKAPARQFDESDADYQARIPTPMAAMVAAFEREDHAEAARTVIRAEQERATNLGHLGPQWQNLVAEHRAVEHRQILAEVVGTDSHALFADPAFDGVLHLMRSAETWGRDPREVAERAYQDGTRLEGARTPAGLFYSLLEDAIEATPPRGSVEQARTYAERTPPGEDERIAYAHGVARDMDTRVAELGEQATVEPPQWAVALLGAAPADPLERAEWGQKVGVVAGYREQYGWTRELDPVGPAPSRAEPEKRWAWARATEALGADARQRDTVEASDASLADRVLAWRREQEWMPRNVDDDLREAHVSAGEARRMVVDARTRGENPAEAVRFVREMEARIGRLEQVAGARFNAVEHTAKTRDTAQEAIAEMQRRVDRDQAAMDRAEARHAADDRDAREAADREARVHAAVGERWQSQWAPDAPVFGSPRWAELDDGEPAKRAGLFNAALQWWRAGDPRDEAEITDRLERHGADVAPEHALTSRGVERVRGGEDEEQVRQTEPSGQLEVLAEVHRYTAPDLEREAPEFGTPDYADADDEGKGKAESRAALRWFGAGDTLDERAERADRLDERAGAAAISRDMAEQRHPFDNRTHAEVVKARGEEPPEPAEPKHVEKPEPVRDEPVERAPKAVAEVKPPTTERDEPVREEKPAREPKQVEQREAEPDEPKQEAKPERVDTSWVREAKEAAERKPEPAPEPKRDDLAEQVARAQAAVDRMQAEKVEAREVAPVQREQQVPVREDAER